MVNLSTSKFLHDEHYKQIAEGSHEYANGRLSEQAIAVGILATAKLRRWKAD
jgi:hypothetical protein